MANCSTSTKIAEYELDLSNVEEIVNYGFNQSYIVTYANFSSKLKSIGTNGFCKAKYLAGKVIIPEGCSLGSSAFNGCESLSLAVINVAEGEVKELPAQLFSASGTNDFVIVITGRVNIAKEEPLPGKDKTNQKIYFPTIAKENNLGYFKENGIYWIAVDTYKDLEAVKKEYKNKTDKPWGYEKILILTEKYSTKELYIKEGYERCHKFGSTHT
jgi:hypothetical protein